MTPAETIESLIKVGVTMKDAYTRSRADDDKLDWAAFVASKEFTAATTETQALLKQLAGGEATRKALTAVREKQAALRGDKKLAELSGEKLGQYHALLQVELQLIHQMPMKTGGPEWLKWLAEDGLPAILLVARTVIPLLV